MSRASSYRARDIQVLKGLEPVRRRPGMYVGGTDAAGLHHLLWEIVDNAVDEVMNGFATTLEVVLDADRRGVRVTDNGRGIPVDIHREYGRPALELILTTLHAGGKFGRANYRYSGGLHGVGASVVNALSSYLEAVVRREGWEHRQEFSRGTPLGPLKKVRPVRGSGTSIYFKPDETIFSDPHFDPDLMRRVLEDRSYLHRFKVVFRDMATGEVHRFDHGEGIEGLLKRMVAALQREPAYDQPFFIATEDPHLEVALQWTAAGGERIHSYVNGIRTPQGGTHEQGFRTGVVRAVRNYMETHGLQPRGVSVAAEDIRDGLVAVVSVYVAEPLFKGQTKEKLSNPELAGQVAGVVAPALEGFFHSKGSLGEAVVARVVEAARTRAALKAATERITRRTTVSHRLNLPGKLADCASNSPQESEIFIVEGDSAGGSAKQARDRHFQAVLPLRGKVLNTEQAGLARVRSNRELADLVSALGCGMGADFDIGRLRYHRIVILTDADADGHHIAGLLLTFFFRHLPRLVEEGHVFLGRPPLYRIAAGKKIYWAWDDDERDMVLANLNGRRAEITRFKGLGEMSPDQLRRTTMDPSTRTLFRVVVGDPRAADTTLRECFGRDVALRYRLVMEGAGEAEEVDY